MRFSRKLLMALAALAAWPAFAAASTETVAGITAFPGFTDTSVALDSLNTIHAAYYDPATQKVLYARRLNGSTAWNTESVDVTVSTHNGRSTMALLGTTPYVVYYDATNGALSYARRTSAGAWQAGTVEAFATDFDVSMCSVVDNNNNLHVVYADNKDGLVDTELRHATFSGGSWSVATIANDLWWTGRCGLAATSSGGLHLIVSYVDAGDLDTYVIYGTLSGGTFQTRYLDKTSLSSSIPNDDVSVALTPSGLAHLAYWDETDAVVRHVRVDTGGGSTLFDVDDLPPPATVHLSMNVRRSDSNPTLFYSSGTAINKAEGTSLAWSTSTVVDGVGSTWGLSTLLNSFDSYFVAHMQGGVPAAALATNAAQNLTLSGSVIDQVSAPLTGVDVALSGNIIDTAQTVSGAGTFSFGTLLEGGYTLTPSRSGYGFQPPTITARIQSDLAGQVFQGGPVGFEQVDNLIDPTAGETVSMTASVLDGPVFVGVYTLNGRLVRELLNEFKTIGDYPVSWDGRNEDGEIVASGIYLVRVESTGFKKIEKVAVVK